MKANFLYTLEVIGCRIYQAVFKIADYVVPYRLPEYIDGPGSILRLPDFLREKKADDLLIVTDRSLMKLGLPNKMLQVLEEEGIPYGDDLIHIITPLGDEKTALFVILSDTDSTFNFVAALMRCETVQDFFDLTNQKYGVH